jgi:hypothetical protein
MKRTGTLKLNRTTIRSLRSNELGAANGGWSGLVTTKTMKEGCSGSCTCQYQTQDECSNTCYTVQYCASNGCL